MQVYQSKIINKEEIDIFSKMLNEKEKTYSYKYDKDRYNFSYRSPVLYLDNGIQYFFRFVYCHTLNKWNLKYGMISDSFYEENEYENEYVDNEYFSSDNSKELLVKYINSKFTYDKHFNNIIRVEESEERELIKKLFPSNIECSVCYDSLSGEYKTKCGHYLCVECFIKIKDKKNCPVCRTCLLCGEDCECDDE